MTAKIAFAAALATLHGGAVAATPACQPVTRLLAQALTDFPSLRQKKLGTGTCVARKSEFKCEWAYPGDAFEGARMQSSELAQCVAVHPGAEARAANRGQQEFSLAPDLSVIVPVPEIDDGNWKVRLRILSAAKGSN